ncbi:MAG: lytic transglycosylase domain-containing protein, partial [Desulfocapsaceae bacterium]|nr:lytic transglycosylase domain-containing protein [Desulfocapsaceae bacterium]
MMSQSRHFLSVYFCIFTLIISCFIPPLSHAEADPKLFPHYKEIAANVIFWEKVYSTYSVNTAIIHDQNDLSIVYAAIPLEAATVPGAQKENSRRIKQAKDHYAGLLARLAEKTKPSSSEEIRVSALFGTRHYPKKYKEAAENIRAQTGLKERFAEGVARSGAYMGKIQQIFRNHGLPEDLAYLPHVESSFDPSAFSKFGASGMWQFTRATGKEFLRIDYIVDERRDPILAAEAAARLLKKNHALLGSWPLALTAYNYGAAGMKRAVNQEGDYVSIFRNYRKGYFKFASRNFYSEFLAAVDVAKKQERSAALRFDKPLSAITVTMPAYVDATQLCAYLGITVNQLRQYNPSLRKPVFDGTKYIPKDFVLKLPYRFNKSKLLSQAPA